MGQDRVRKVSKLSLCLLIVPADRGSGNISAGHHQAVRHAYFIRIIKQQHLHRGIGEHDSDLRIARRNRLAEIRTFFLLKQQNGFQMALLVLKE